MIGRTGAGRMLARLLAGCGCIALVACHPPSDARIRPVDQLPLALQAYLSVDAYFIAQGMVRGRLANGGLDHDQARDLVASALYARQLTAENMLHPTADGQHRTQMAIELMLSCVRLADSGSNAACLGRPVSGAGGSPAAAAFHPAEAESAPR